MRIELIHSNGERLSRQLDRVGPRKLWIYVGLGPPSVGFLLKDGTCPAPGYQHLRVAPASLEAARLRAPGSKV